MAGYSGIPVRRDYRGRRLVRRFQIPELAQPFGLQSRMAVLSHRKSRSQFLYQEAASRFR